MYCEASQTEVACPTKCASRINTVKEMYGGLAWSGLCGLLEEMY